jgi:hypothetical protein
MVFLLAVTAAAAAGDQAADGVALRRYSERTIVVGVEIDRDSAKVLGFTRKDRPFDRDPEPAPSLAYEDGAVPQIEVALLGRDGIAYTTRIEVPGLCLTHEPDRAPHVAGDTILTHRDSVVVEVPELPGGDRIEVAYYETSRGAFSRRSLGVATLEASSFQPAGSRVSYSDLAFATSTQASEAPPPLTSGVVHWPEEYSDPDIYKLYGNAAETARRVNVVIVPDGYTYAQKSIMQSHADAMVAYFRAKTPYKEHDPFVNYVLVYAYSTDPGTDECDCDALKDTAMGTRFPDAGYPCGNSGNRCLYYGSGGCDTNSSGNITAAELRAPAIDRTIVMVNTARYGGCGGVRAVYSAANSSATEVAVHELGHTLGGLADEYGGAGCGHSASNVNTSLNASQGAWPEWVPTIGAPREGGDYHDQCVYRPEANCEMRALGFQFCAVCNQKWSLTYFGHTRVAPTAPLESVSPSSPASAETGVPATFSASTRLAVGALVTNSMTWTLQAPGDPEPVTIATGTPVLEHTFSVEGTHLLTFEIVADTNFVKPAKYGSNRDTATWIVDVVLARPGEVSPPGAVQPQMFTDAATMIWDDAAASGSTTFNVYRGTTAGLAAGDHGTCFRTGLTASTTTDSDPPAEGECFTYLVTGRTSGGEGTMGTDSAGAPRENLHPCP